LFPARLGNKGRGLGYTTCQSCHLNSPTGRQRGILGFITPQLRLLSNGKDQIQDLMDKGYLVKRENASYDPATAHRWYALDDSTSPGATLEKRARSYLASNCSHCHNPEGGISCKPIYTYTIPNAEMNYMNKASVGKWGVVVPAPDSAKWIYPGKPEYSTILRRISAADSDGYRDAGVWDFPGNRRVLSKAGVAGWDGNGRVQMPPEATYEVNPLANRIIHAWIKNLPSGTSGIGTKGEGGARSSGWGKIRISHGLLYLPEEMQEVKRIMLTDLVGNKMALTAARGGVFRLPAGLKSGIYSVHAGRTGFTLAYFPSLQNFPSGGR
jgi:hypothetical protein